MLECLRHTGDNEAEKNHVFDHYPYFPNTNIVNAKLTLSVFLSVYPFENVDEK